MGLCEFSATACGGEAENIFTVERSKSEYDSWPP